MLESTIKIGNILLAEPFMMDPNFKRSAVLLCDHQEQEGSVGFILNRPLQTQIDELIPDFPTFAAEVFFGGPVQTDTIHYLHNVGELLEESVEVCRGVYWGGDFDKLKLLVRSSLIQPAQIRFFMGYTGWSEGQLQDEMKFGSWILAEMDANYLFKEPPATLWQSIMRNKGNAFTILSQIEEDTSWN